MTTCAIYCRISTDETLQRWSLPAQVKELRDLAARRGWAVFREYADAVSGSLSSRPGLDKLRDDMAAGRFTAVLVVDQDRLSRMDPVDWEFLKKEIRECGVRIITPAQEVDFADEDSELVSDVFNLFARHQRRKIKKAMRRGRAQAVQSGRWLGRAPYGRVLREDGVLDLDPVAAPVVNKIFTLYSQGLGARRIAGMLNPFPGPGGGKWNQTSILRVLVNRVHRGDLVRWENGKKICLQGVFRTTVPVDLFDRCRAILDGRKGETRWHRVRQATNLASGIVACGLCGRVFNIVPINSSYRGKKYRYFYYRHTNRAKGVSGRGPCACFHRADEVDSRLVICMKIVGSSPAAARLLNRDTNRGEEIKGLYKKMDDLKNAIRALENRREKLVGLYLMGTWDREKLDKQDKMIRDQIQANLADQDGLKNLIKISGKGDRDDSLYQEYLAALSMIDREMSGDDKRFLVQALFRKVVVDPGGDMAVSVRLPVDACFYLPGCLQGIRRDCQKRGAESLCIFIRGIGEDPV